MKHECRTCGAPIPPLAFKALPEKAVQCGYCDRHLDRYELWMTATLDQYHELVNETVSHQRFALRSECEPYFHILYCGIKVEVNQEKLK
jgi:hypothetical protein